MQAIAEFRESGRKFQDTVEERYDTSIDAIVDSLKSVRKKRGYTQQDIADATGMKSPNITRIETHKTRPSVEILMRYAAALGYDIEISLRPR